jgi:vacuolar-type H+-ATPase subunit I/STV1
VADFITCPSCQRQLKIPANTEAAWFTCPACLAKIQNPATQITSVPPTPPETEKLPKEKESKEANLHRTAITSEVTKTIGSLDREVDRDTKITAYALITLLALGGIGYVLSIVWYFVHSPAHGSDRLADAERFAWMTLIFGGFVFAMIFCLGAFVRPKLTGKPIGFFGVVGVACLALFSAFIVVCLGCTALLSGM